MSKIKVVDGAVLICSCGSIPCKLIVDSQFIVKIDKRSIATKKDIALKNINNFGTCKMQNKPCIPNLIDWFNCLPSKINDKNILSHQSFCSCMNGGMITVENSAQIGFVKTK